MEKFGFLQMQKFHINDNYTIHSCSDKLFETVMERIHHVKQFNCTVPDHPDHVMKVAYFKVLNNNELVNLNRLTAQQKYTIL